MVAGSKTRPSCINSVYCSGQVLVVLYAHTCPVPLVLHTELAGTFGRLGANSCLKKVKRKATTHKHKRACHRVSFVLACCGFFALFANMNLVLHAEFSVSDSPLQIFATGKVDLTTE